MKVCTYWQYLGQEAPKKLLTAWRESWEQYGFEPLVLTDIHAEAHPEYRHIHDWAHKQPTLNAKNYEVSCFIRWLAYSKHLPCMIADYDVINFGFTPKDVQKTFEAFGQMTFYMTPDMLEGFIHFLPTSKPVNGHHSDMYAWCQYLGVEAMLHPLSTAWGCEGYMTRPLVHFCNPYLKPEWRFDNRWKGVEDLQHERSIFNGSRFVP